MKRIRKRAVEPAAQRRVGRYRLERPIGTGASATVYLARLEGEAGFAREYALKLVHAPLPFSEGEDEDEEVDVGQPLVEARVASRIRHPNVVSVLDMGRDDDGRIFLVMEYIEGPTLNQILRKTAEAEERVPLSIAMRILDDLLAGLHAAHEARGDDGQTLGLVHRDVSPHNVIVGNDGVTRLTDFGIAKVTDATLHTAIGVVKGKPGYMAPEQLKGDPLDRRADLWAAGVIAWELFAGKRLYKAKDLMSLSLEIITKQPPSLLGERPDLPPAIGRAIARALSRERDQRYETCEELRNDLAEAGLHPARTDHVARWLRGGPEPAPSLPSSPDDLDEATVPDGDETGPPSPAVAPAPAPSGAPSPSSASLAQPTLTPIPAPRHRGPIELDPNLTSSTATLEAMVASKRGIAWRSIMLVTVVLGGAGILIRTAIGASEGPAPAATLANPGPAVAPPVPGDLKPPPRPTPPTIEAEPQPPTIDLDTEASAEPAPSASGAAPQAGGRPPKRPRTPPPAKTSPKLMGSPYN